MSSSLSPPSQETFERVFNLQRRVEPDHENHITSSFGVLDINNNGNDTLDLGSSSRNLEIFTSRRRSSKKLLGKTWNTTAQSDFVNNITCLPPTRSGNDHDHNLALSSQENYPLATDFIAILSNSRAENQLPGNSNNPSTPKSSSSSIYSHSLLRPICKP